MKMQMWVKFLEADCAICFFVFRQFSNIGLFASKAQISLSTSTSQTEIMFISDMCQTRDRLVMELHQPQSVH